MTGKEPDDQKETGDMPRFSSRFFRDRDKHTGRVINTEDPEQGIWTLNRVIYSNGAVKSSITSVRCSG
jgi:hypothetical protein